jgi:hypothetical protein
VTFPSATTSCINTGFNLVESVAAAPPDWWNWAEAAAARLRASRRVPVSGWGAVVVVGVVVVGVVVVEARMEVRGLQAACMGKRQPQGAADGLCLFAEGGAFDI